MSSTGRRAFSADQHGFVKDMPMCVPTSPAVSVNRRTLLSGLGAMTGLTALSACSPERTASTVDRTDRPPMWPFTPRDRSSRHPGRSAVDTTRAGIATALVVDGATYVVDCGRGAPTQYPRRPRLRRAQGIFITHLHADHVADYYDFFSLAGAAPNHMVTASEIRSTCTDRGQRVDCRTSSAAGWHPRRT